MRVKLKDVGKKYEGREEFTLQNINLEIEDKDFCVILGPSGCGKTTMLRMIAGLNSITEGDLIFDDKRVNKILSKDRDIAMVFQSYALYPHMTVYDNMAFSLSMRKERKDIIHDRVLEAARTLQIEDYLYSKPSDISGGQRQRVALGRAIVRNPKLFLMDEPLSNLDAKLREHMRIELVRLHQMLDTTTIYVTHDQVEAMTMATKIVLMNDGIIQQVGTPEEFYSEPHNIFVAKFMGSPTMNIVEGSFDGKTIKTADKTIKITPNEKDLKRLQSHNNNNVSVGIRSERFIADDKGENSFTVMVDVVENLGKEKVLYSKLNDSKEFIISVPGHLSYKARQEYNFAFDVDALHFFCTDTGVRI